MAILIRLSRHSPVCLCTQAPVPHTVLRVNILHCSRPVTRILRERASSSNAYTKIPLRLYAYVVANPAARPRSCRSVCRSIIVRCPTGLVGPRTLSAHDPQPGGNKRDAAQHHRVLPLVYRLSASLGTEQRRRGKERGSYTVYPWAPAARGGGEAKLLVGSWQLFATGQSDTGNPSAIRMDGIGLPQPHISAALGSPPPRHCDAAVFAVVAGGPRRCAHHGEQWQVACRQNRALIHRLRLGTSHYGLHRLRPLNGRAVQRVERPPHATQGEGDVGGPERVLAVAEGQV
ncbi:hypothetical protein FB451DRAFT_1509688 [Mycena latifolia]|nr:hypothetical protein FB451DRAFT_1509688 [Mycena latifolia]